MDNDLKNRTLTELEKLVADFQGKKYLAKYIFSFIHAKDALAIDDITPLAKPFRQKLIDAGFHISRLNTVEKFTDPDGTVKYLFELQDRQRIESVLLTDDGPDKRRTLCISCQVGCRMGCDFCATGRLNFIRNLTAGEIADQLNVIAKDSGKINNVVYMGMGEPLDNYGNVIRSLEIINHHAGKFIGQRHITVSTCGMTDGIEALADEPIKPRLAVSLHAPTDELREKIMPPAKKYPLDRLIGSLKIYRKKTKKRVTFEYCLIKNLNDSALHAQKLIELVVGLNPAVNLIEYNPHPGCAFEPTPKKRILRFRDILMNASIETVIRYKRGQKINAACGQLGAYLLKLQ